MEKFSELLEACDNPYQLVRLASWVAHLAEKMKLEIKIAEVRQIVKKDMEVIAMYAEKGKSHECYITEPGGPHAIHRVRKYSAESAMQQLDMEIIEKEILSRKKDAASRQSEELRGSADNV